MAQQNDTTRQAITVGLQAGTIALIIRLAFAFLLEKMPVGDAVRIGVVYFVGTAVVSIVIYLIIVAATRRRRV